jgi:uncharacterized membrane protein (DUF2068 family)
MSSALTSAPAKTAHSHKGGLRTVALLEALKGVLALLAGALFISMVHREVNFETAAESILFYLHIDPYRRLSQVFLDIADKMSDINVWMVAAIAIAYAALRLLEGYGLWRQRVWAEWLAIVSGCVYIPFEVYSALRRPTEFHWIILGINILVVLYIGWVRWDEIVYARAQQPQVEGGAD